MRASCTPCPEQRSSKASWAPGSAPIVQWPVQGWLAWHQPGTDWMLSRALETLQQQFWWLFKSNGSGRVALDLFLAHTALQSGGRNCFIMNHFTAADFKSFGIRIKLHCWLLFFFPRSWVFRSWSIFFILLSYGPVSLLDVEQSWAKLCLFSRHSLFYLNQSLWCHLFSDSQFQGLRRRKAW